jgi:hypothetical protein
MTAHDVDRIVWGEPDSFVWQPGHRWALGKEKGRRVGAPDATHRDVRERPLVPQGPVELRATTLASGVTLKVSRRLLDSAALFSVRSAGNIVELVLNSGHEVFATMPMPFEDPESSDEGFKSLVEILLQAWALYEDSVFGGASRRAAEDVRLLWGRRIIELLRDVDGES